MAITVQEQPYSATKVGQKLIYRLTSSNVANDGFKFVFKIYEGTTNLISTIYVPPTPEATPQGILDLSPVLKHRMDIRHKSFDNEHSVGYGESDYPYYLYKVTMQEGYNVAGVFTIQATTTTKYHYLLPCSYAHMDGYKPNPDNRYGLDGITKLLMGDRNSGTHIPRNIPTGLSASSSRVFIPVRDNNMDYGNLYYITDYADTLSAKDSGISTATSVKMKLVTSTGTNVFATKAIDDNGLVVIPAYPKSLEGTTSLIDPADYPNSADRGLMEGDIETRTQLAIASDYIRENEFALLKNLVRSKAVYIINDDGSILPVVIEDNGFISRRTRDGKVYNITLRVRYSNEDL